MARPAVNSNAFSVVVRIEREKHPGSYPCKGSGFASPAELLFFSNLTSSRIAWHP